MDSEDDTRDSADEDFYSDGEAGLALSDDGDADYDFADRDSDDSDGPISHRQQVIIDRSIGAVPPDRSRPRDCLLGTVEMGDPVAICGGRVYSRTIRCLSVYWNAPGYRNATD
jgi:hypothetical protein